MLFFFLFRDWGKTCQLFRVNGFVQVFFVVGVLELVIVERNWLRHSGLKREEWTMDETGTL